MNAATRLIDDEGRDLRRHAPGDVPGGLDIFTSRGIVPPWEPDGVVARARGYLRYEQHDPESIFAADPRLAAKYARVDRDPHSFGEMLPDHVEEEDDEEDDGRGRRPRRKTLNTWVRHRASFCGGWVMPKHAVLAPGEAAHEGYPEYDHPLAQLRPDRPIPGKAWGHDHDGMVHRKQHFRHHRAGLCWCGVKHRQERVCWCGKRHRQDGETCPCGSAHPQAKSASWRTKPLRGFARSRHELGKHHLHPETGEEITPIKGVHRHQHEGKYQLTPGSSAKRFDRSPLTEWDGIELAAIVLEGTPKNDAVVEWGRKTGVRIGVANTASVTTWDALRIREDQDPRDPDDVVYTFLRELNALAERHLRDGRRWSSATPTGCTTRWCGRKRSPSWTSFATLAFRCWRALRARANTCGRDPTA
jgi:hypothetical protein